MDNRNFDCKAGGRLFPARRRGQPGHRHPKPVRRLRRGRRALSGENGFIGMGPTVQEGLMENERLVNAGWVPLSPCRAARLRCGHVLQRHPPDVWPPRCWADSRCRPGGSGQLATPAGALRHGGAPWICATGPEGHCGHGAGGPGGRPKVVSGCTLPSHRCKCVNHIVTDLCVIDVTKEAGHCEIRKGHTVEEIQAAVEPVLLVSPDLKEMAGR